MARLRHVRDCCAALVSLDSEDSDYSSDEEDLVVLYRFAAEEARLVFPSSGPRFSLDACSEADAIHDFRFRKSHIRRLCHALRLPDTMASRNRTQWSGEEGLCILLRRLAYPCRLKEMMKWTGRGQSELSIIINDTLDFIYAKWSGHLLNLDQPWLTNECLESLCEAVAGKAPVTKPLFIWGFIDGTPRPVCRPKIAQRLFYSGHKRVHCLKFQSIMCANGIMAHMFGPIEGSRHDAAMLRESGLLEQLGNQMRRSATEVYAVYGDPAYPLQPHLMRPYTNPTPLQQDFNRQCSSVRQSVEWGFGNILRLWAFLDFKKSQKILLCPVAKYFAVATLLTNCYTCLYGCETMAFFGTKAPSLETYLQ